MPVAYPPDFHRAVSAHVGRGPVCSHIASVLGPSCRFVINLMRRYREVGAQPSKLIGFQDEIMGWITEQPDLALAHMAERLMGAFGVKASSSGLSSRLCGAGYTYKNLFWQTGLHGAGIRANV